MKKLVYAIAALAALSLLAPTSGFAQLDISAKNQIGLYTDAMATAANVTGVENMDSVELYVVVSNPHNYVSGEDITSVKGYEMGLVIPSGVTLLSAVEWPTDQVLNVGNNTNHLVGFASPLPVVDGLCHVCTLTIFYLGGGAEVAISTTTASPPSIDDRLAILDGADETTIPMFPSSGDFANPVFVFNGDVVATQSTSMDNIKAMYR